MKVILYTIGCPACKMLESKLDAKNIAYDKVSDEAVLREKGIDVLPKLEVDGQMMGLAVANSWINNQ